MAVKTTRITFEAIGQADWYAVVRTNPRSGQYDDFLSSDNERFWLGLSALVLEWNLADENGEPLPLPSRGLTLQDLPVEVISHLIREYVRAFEATVAVPKAPENGSASSSTTSAGSERLE